ncbi:MAG: FAD-dependent oxidoreductase [Nitrosopumilus sp.]|nr:FAD-dependent oxidoreductase [Nitrosopumilus sp.]
MGGGRTPCSMTVIIYVSRIKGIIVNSSEKTVTVGAGVKWGEFNHALSAYRLHTPGGRCVQ